MTFAEAATIAGLTLSVAGMMLVIAGVLVAGLFLPGVVLIGISLVAWAAAGALHALDGSQQRT